MICAVSISETESKTQLSILCIYHIHIFFHPDFTVGLGISPNHALRLVGYTTGRELHPALKNNYFREFQLEVAQARLMLVCIHLESQILYLKS